LQVGDTGPVESARRSNSRVLGSPFSGLSGHYVFFTLLNFLGKSPLSVEIVKFTILRLEVCYSHNVLNT
jgi:hypothetical protein